MTKAGIKSAPTTNAQLLADAQTLYKYYGTGVLRKTPDVIAWSEAFVAVSELLYALVIAE